MVKRRQPQDFATVPRLLPNGGTVLVLGSGPSLTQTDVSLTRAHVDAVIAVNDSYKLIPDATVLYAADTRWWGWHKGARTAHTVGAVKYPAFIGRLRYCLGRTPFAEVQVLRRGPRQGLTLDPAKVALGMNGVYQSINVAVHLGATRVLLLGLDMHNKHGSHFFGHHPNQSQPPYALCIQAFQTMVEPLQTAGVEIVNCTPGTAVKAFPRVPLVEALGIQTAVAV